MLPGLGDRRGDGGDVCSPKGVYRGSPGNRRRGARKRKVLTARRWIDAARLLDPELSRWVRVEYRAHPSGRLVDRGRRRCPSTSLSWRALTTDRSNEASCRGGSNRFAERRRIHEAGQSSTRRWEKVPDRCRRRGATRQAHLRKFRSRRRPAAPRPSALAVADLADAGISARGSRISSSSSRPSADGHAARSTRTSPPVRSRV